MKEALFYESKEGGRVQCVLCPHNCVIANNKTGICGVRKNQSGKLVSLVYGKLCSTAIDPIEKKPLFHFAPGTECFSICTVGCNLSCSFCQNSEISHPSAGTIVGNSVSAHEVVDLAKKHNVPGIAYTYTEPTIALEFYLEVMKLARKEGLYNVWVSNGYINPEPAKMAAKYIDAINVDLKGDGKFYSELCGVPDESPIREAIKIYKKMGVWVELTNLIIPGFNDQKEQINNLVHWVMDNLGEDTPIHFSRFHPYYKMLDVKATPVETLNMAVSVAREHGLKWAYIGNVAGDGHEDSFCPKCGNTIVKRNGLRMKSFKDRCNQCNVSIPLSGRKWVK